MYFLVIKYNFGYRLLQFCSYLCATAVLLLRKQLYIETVFPPTVQQQGLPHLPGRSVHLYISQTMEEKTKYLVTRKCTIHKDSVISTECSVHHKLFVQDVHE